MVLAQELWHVFLRERRVIWFVDNDAARHALIKGASPSGPSAALAGAFWSNEERLGSFSWVERVPTQCNPADGPSRLFFQDAVSSAPRYVRLGRSCSCGASGSSIVGYRRAAAQPPDPIHAPDQKRENITLVISVILHACFAVSS